MVFHLDIPLSIFTIFSMIFLGLSLFRVSLKVKWPLVLAASVVCSCFGNLLWILGAESLSPMLLILLQAVLIHYIFRLRKLHSLMVAFIGSLGYTLYLAVVLFAATVLASISVEDFFYDVHPLSRVPKLVAATLSYLTSYVLIKRRLGFTVRMELRPGRSWLPHNNVLFVVFVLAFVLFSLTYYAITLHMTTIFYFAAGFCLLLAWIFYLLYKKEMEES